MMFDATVRRTVLALAFGGALVASGAAAQLAGYRLNVTPSVPLGIWRVHTADSLVRGDVVTVCPPDNETSRMARARGYLMHGSCPGSFIPLIKPVGAVAGDRVMINAAGVHVNGRLVPDSRPLKRDTAGRPLAVAFKGEREVPEGRIFVVSSYNRLSYDSRYFGMVPVANVRGVAVPKWISRWKPPGE